MILLPSTMIYHPVLVYSHLIRVAMQPILSLIKICNLLATKLSIVATSNSGSV